MALGHRLSDIYVIAVLGMDAVDTDHGFFPFQHNVQRISKYFADIIFYHYYKRIRTFHDLSGSFQYPGSQFLYLAESGMILSGKSQSHLFHGAFRFVK